LVEQLICNQQVGGSSPSTSSTNPENPACASTEYGGVPEWPKGADCKSVVSDFDGSNPSSSTKTGSVSNPLAGPVFMRKSAYDAGLRGIMLAFTFGLKTDETALKRSIKCTVNAQ
jgi:hypothetical protein